MPQGRSSVIRGRQGPLIQALGEERLTLLEILAMSGVDFRTAERIYIGREGRTKVVSVLGRISYQELTLDSKNDLPLVIDELIKNNEARFVSYLNELQPLTPRLHALELIPGIGKTFMEAILREREKQPFTSFQDLQKRTGLREPSKLIAKRVLEEISGETRVTIFVRRY